MLIYNCSKGKSKGFKRTNLSTKSKKSKWFSIVSKGITKEKGKVKNDFQEVENMKNEIVILDAKQKLAEQGLIKYTGRTLMIELMDGSEYTFKETEQIHTFMEWKRLGYKVKKGSKAITKLRIWIPTVKENEDGIKTTKFWLKNSAFFSESQVEKIKEKRGEK